MPRHNPFDYSLPHVTTYSPMKRGLKVGIRCVSAYYRLCYNLFPDEKGTESCLSVSNHHRHCVTTYSPMKRGLKVHMAEQKA